MNPTVTHPPAATHVLRCVHCGAAQADAGRMFRCRECSELLEVVYPERAGAAREFGLRLKEIWRARKGGTLP